MSSRVTSGHSRESQSHHVDVRDYYDRNTRAFLRLGHGGNLGVIRRRVWGPGVRDRNQAALFVEMEIEKRIAALGVSAPYVLDLGCGVCSTLCRLAERLPLTGVGVTLSAVQTEYATQLIAAHRLSERVRCLTADFNELPDAIGGVDAAFAIESFVHGSEPGRFFQESAGALRPGGLLVICDDFLSLPELRGASASTMIDRFMYGWHIGSLLTLSEASELARAAGLVLHETLDLSPFLELGRPRDVLINALMRVAGKRRFRSEYLRMLQGGDALQTCLRQGHLKYLFTVWKRQESR